MVGPIRIRPEHIRFQQTELRDGASGGGDMHAAAIEDEVPDFTFGAVNGDFLAIQNKRDPRGIADADADFARGADRSVRWGNESLLSDKLAVGKGGNPGILGGSNLQR